MELHDLGGYRIGNDYFLRRPPYATLFLGTSALVGVEEKALLLPLYVRTLYGISPLAN